MALGGASRRVLVELLVDVVAALASLGGPCLNRARTLFTALTTVPYSRADLGCIWALVAVGDSSASYLSTDVSLQAVGRAKGAAGETRDLAPFPKRQ